MPSIRKAVFPVGGLGTRLLPLSRAISKELMRISGNKSLIDYAVKEAQDSGIEECIFVIGEKGEMLRSYFKGGGGDDRPFSDMTMRFVHQESPLGLGHAVLAAKEAVGGESFAVLLPDDLILSESPLLGEMLAHHKKKRSSLVALQNVPHEKTDRYGIVDVLKKDGRAFQIRNLIEKPPPSEAPSSYAIVGRYVLDANIFQHLEKTAPGAAGEIQLTDALKSALQETPLGGLLMKGVRFDCGTTEGLDQASLALIPQNG